MAPSQLAAAHSAPSPAPSNGSNKRKFEEAPAKPLPGQVTTSKAPTDVLAQYDYTVRFLIEKETPQTFNQIITYLSIQAGDAYKLDELRKVLQGKWDGTKIEYDPRGANGEGSYRFKPKIPVRNAEELKGYLQRQDHSVGVKIDDLKDGWKDCNAEILRMEQADELLVIRNAKELPRTIWQDDPSMNNKINKELTDAWFAIPLPPNPDDLRRKLLDAKLKPTSAPRIPVGVSRPQEKKKKVARRGGRQTNTHMAHVLKDYSSRRK